MSEITVNPLETVVADAVDDSVIDSTSSPDLSSTSDVDSSQVDLSTSPSDEAIVADPATDTTPQDDFEKKWGFPAVSSITGRENRLPHSRVKTMVTKADQEGYARGLKEAEGKATPQLTELGAKVTDYEGRLGKVAQFENLLENDPKTFLSMLSQIPAYKGFFDYISNLAKTAAPQQPQAPYLDNTTMPQPDQTLTDGSKVYSMEGLAKRDEWLARQVEERTLRQADARFSERLAPIEQERQYRQRMDQMVPVIERQIAEARQWPNFAELEPEVIKLLKADQSISLERAYVKAYQDHIIPRSSVDRNKMRTELLAELKQKPISSSAPGQAIRPGTPAAGPRTMEQIIQDSIREAGLS